MLKRQKIREVKQLDDYKLNVCHPLSAGIDIGSREIYVALPPDIAQQKGIEIVHVFQTFTQDLNKCKDLLLSCGITTVSMESTSVYWMTLFTILQECDIEVCLVNPKKFRMVPGRKTDVQDCQWLQILHTYGLLRGSFHPTNDIAALRSLMRHRDTLIKDRARYIQRMQKAMTRMNLLLHNVIDDITGKSGIAIIEAILSGQRDPKTLADLCDVRIKASNEEVIKSLEGFYCDDQLFLLKQNYEFYCFFNNQIEDSDKLVETMLVKFPLKKPDQQKRPPNHKPRNSKSKNSLKTELNLEDLLYRITGVDLISLPGFRGQTVLQIISEVGLDMSKFPNDKHFASYMGFVPHNKITGGRIISSRTDRIKSTAAQAFRKVIPSISRSDTALGAFYRRLAPRIGKGAAITACARKLSMMYYNTLMHGNGYVEYGQEQYKQQQMKTKQRRLRKLAKECNMVISPAE